MVPRIYSLNSSIRIGTLLLFLFAYSFSFGQSPPVFDTPCPLDQGPTGMNNFITLPAGDASVGGGSVTFTSANIPQLLGITASDPDGTAITYSATPTTITCAELNGATSDIFFITVTATDESNVSTNCLVIVEVVNGGPLAMCVNNFEVVLDASGNGSITAADIDGGTTICDGTILFDLSQSSFTCADVGAPIPVTLTASTSFFNPSFFETSCVTMVTVVDPSQPTISNCPSNVNITTSTGGTGDCEGELNWIHPTVIDNCDASDITMTYTLSGATTQSTPTAFTSGGAGVDNFETGVTFVNYFVNDGTFDGTPACSFSVSVTDNEVPTSACNDITIALNSLSGTYTLNQANKNAITAGSMDNCGITSILFSPESFNCTQLNTAVPVTVTYSDGVTAAQSCTALVTVTESLVFNNPPANNMFLSCTDAVPTGQGNITASSSCSPVSVNYNEVSTQGLNPACPNNYQVTRTWTATNGNGGMISTTQNVFVSDDAKPETTFGDTTLIVDAEVNNASGCDAMVNNEFVNLTAATVSDNCSAFGDLTISHTINGGSVVMSGDASGTYTGMNEIIFTITDQCGKTTTRTVNVNVVDAVAPVAACQDVMINIPEGATSVTVTSDMINDGSFDECSGVTLFVPVPNTFSCSDLTNGIGTFFITLGVAEDVAIDPDTSYCIASVTIQDNNDPMAICQDVTVTLDANGQASVTPDMVNNNSVDNCSGIVSYDFLSNAQLVSQIDYDVTNVGVSNTVTLVVTDVIGNSDICTANVTVEAPNTCFDIDDNFVANTGTNEVPLYTTNFINVTGFQFSILLTDVTVANYLGVNNINPSLISGGTFSTPSINGDILTISWLSNGTPLTLNAAQLFTISLDVTGAIGTTADLNFINGGMTPPVVTTDFGGTAFTNNAPCLDDGDIEVSQLAIITVSGNVRTWDAPALPVNNVEIGISEDQGPSSLGATTGIDGNYSADVTNQVGGVDLILDPSKDINWLNGGQVNSNDLFFIQQHTVQNIPFTSVYQYIAADANSDGIITIQDLVLIQDVIVNSPTSPFPSPNIALHESWKFVPASDMLHLDPLPALPTAPVIDDTIRIDNLTASRADVDWIGIKVGHVDGPLDPSMLVSTTVDTREGKSLTLNVENQKVVNNELISIPVYAKDYEAFTAWQFSLSFDVSTLVFENVVPGAITDFSKNRLGLNNLANGLIGAAWYGNPVEVKDDEVLFTLEFRAIQNAEALSGLIEVNSESVNAASFLMNGASGDVNLQFFSPTLTADATFELHQNRPNPFSSRTLVSFTLPEAGFAKMTLFDMSGKVLREVEGDFAKGYNEISLSSNDFSAKGVLYYQLESASNTATKKMIILD